MKKKEIKTTQKKQSNKITIILLGVVILAISLFLANYINNKKVTSDTEAATKKVKKCHEDDYIYISYPTLKKCIKRIWKATKKEYCRVTILKVVNPSNCGLGSTTRSANCPGEHGEKYFWSDEICYLKYGKVGDKPGTCVDKVVKKKKCKGQY